MGWTKKPTPLDTQIIEDMGTRLSQTTITPGSVTAGIVAEEGIVPSAVDVKVFV
jgi:hypothetical protein